MTLMNSHVTPLQSLRPWGGLAAVGPKFWGTGAAFIAVYFALNLLTEWHEFDRLGITLWSPDDGLSLALLLESVAFAPFVFFGAVLVDLSIAGVHRSIGVTMAAELSLTITYVSLAFLLKNQLNFNIRQFRLADVVTFLLFIPAAATLLSFIYCGVFYLGGELSADKVFVAIGHCWIGVALGMITIIPATTTTVFSLLIDPAMAFGPAIRCSFHLHLRGGNMSWIRGARWGRRQIILFVQSAFLAGHLAGDAERGYAGVALALVTIQLTLAVVTAFVGYNTTDFAILQLLMLVLSITGLLLSETVTTERQDAALRLREQKRGVGADAVQRPGLARWAWRSLTKSANRCRQWRPTCMPPGGCFSPALRASRSWMRWSRRRTEAHRAREVLERIRDFVSNGNLNLEALDLSAIAQKIVALCGEEAAERGIQKWRLKRVGPGYPRCRRTGVQIEQVLINLVANAIDAASERSDARGRVIIRIATHADAVAIRGRGQWQRSGSGARRQHF